MFTVKKENLMQGKLIIIEGGDCSGKSTFVRFLKEKQLPEVFFTNEPGGNMYGMKIRRLLLNEEGAEESDNLTKFHLYWASKAENFRREIFPRLKAGQIVVSDRFEGSTFAYQVSEDPMLEDLFWTTRANCFGNVTPVYIHFDVSAEIAHSRAIARVGEVNYFDKKGVEYRKRVSEFYSRFFRNNQIHSYRVDASLPPDEMLKSAYDIFCQIAEL